MPLFGNNIATVHSAFPSMLPHR